MDTRPDPLSPEALLAHADWVRALAGRLVADPSRADDIAQQAWVSALESPPRDERNLRGWLATIVRNTAREFGRNETRRTKREQIAARPEATPSTDELVQRATMQRAVVDLVLGLDEPYRTVVLLRWFEGLTPREIAQRTQRPIDTVTTQLSRAHEKLRTRLDREWGGRDSWCSAFVLIARSPSVSTGIVGGSIAAGIGAWIMTMGWKVAMAGAALLVGAWLWWGTHDGAAQPTIGATSGPSHVKEIAHVDMLPSASADSSERTAIEGAMVDAKATASVSTSESLATLTVEGRVVDERGNPIARLPLVAHAHSLPTVEEGRLRTQGLDVPLSATDLAHLRSDESALAAFVAAHPAPGVREIVLGTQLDGRTETDADGWFHIEATGPRETGLRVRSADPRWTIFTNGFDSSTRKRIYIAAPPVNVEGVVLRSDERPVEGAQACVDLYVDNLRHLPYELHRGESSIRRGDTDATGRFRIEALPLVDGLKIRAYSGSGISRPVIVTAENANALRLELTPPPKVRIVSGTVIDFESLPVANARVAFSSAETKSDSAGRFELRVNEFRAASTLVALVDGEAIGKGPDVAALLATSTNDVEGVVVRLERARLAIEGRIVDSRGEPCVGWDVDVYDPTPFRGEYAEARASGVEYGVKSDAQGGFRIGGLLPRSYRIRAIHAEKQGFVLSAPIEAGSRDVELRVAADANLPRISGRVVSRTGDPIVGATISLSVDLGRNEQGHTVGYVGSPAKTDERGQFEIHDVPRSNVALNVSGDGIAPRKIEVADIAHPEALDIVVGRVCTVRFDIDARGPIDGIAFVDANGKWIEVTERDGFDLPKVKRIARDIAGFPACEVSDEATAIVLFHGDTELRRAPVTLSSQTLNFLRP